MGRDLHYVPGDYYQVDDRTGFPTRATRTRKQWNDLIVDEKVWEPRQPQDLVRGVPDAQSVPDPRVKGPDLYVGPVYLELTADAGIGAVILSVASLKGAQIGYAAAVMLASNVNFFTTIAGFPAAGQILLRDPLPYYAPAQNLVTVLRQNANPIT